MFQLKSKPAPEWITLFEAVPAVEEVRDADDKVVVPAQDAVPAVRVQFAPINRSARRRAARAAREVLGDVVDIKAVAIDELFDAGEAGSRELIRRGILAWEGIGDDQGNPIEPTQDAVERDDDGAVIQTTPGTISLFLDDDDLFEAADRLYVQPGAEKDREKNASAALPSGTGEAVTQESGTAISVAKPKGPAAAKSARTRNSTRSRTKAKRSGQS